MLNGSFSLNAHLCRDEDVVDREDVVPQKLFFSVGDGGRYTPESLISLNCLGQRMPCLGTVGRWEPTTQLVLDRLRVAHLELL